MGDVLIRDVDEHLIQRLKSKAKANGTSLQVEARTALARGAPLTAKERGRLLDEFARTDGGFPQSDVTGAEIIRGVRHEA